MVAKAVALVSWAVTYAWVLGACSLAGAEQWQSPEEAAHREFTSAFGQAVADAMTLVMVAPVGSRVVVVKDGPYRLSLGEGTWWYHVVLRPEGAGWVADDRPGTGSPPPCNSAYTVGRGPSVHWGRVCRPEAAGLRVTFWPGSEVSHERLHPDGRFIFVYDLDPSTHRANQIPKVEVVDRDGKVLQRLSSDPGSGLPTATPTPLWRWPSPMPQAFMVGE